MAADTIRVVARLVARPDRAAELSRLLVGLIAPTRREDGCLRYELWQNLNDRSDFTFVEEWENETALDAHLSSRHVTEMRSRLHELLAQPADLRTYKLLG
jgi:quinol monooxygenase YgiN